MYGTPQFAQPRGGTYLTGAALSRSPRRRLQRFSGLGALTPDQATEQVFPAAQVKNSAGHNQAARDQILASANAGQILNGQGGLDYVPGTSQCSASGVSSNVKLAQISGTLALTGISTLAASVGSTAAVTMLFGTAIGTTVGAVLGPLTMGISTIIGLLPLLLGHHARAVKKEQSALCFAVPAANNYLQIIDQAVSTGQATPQQAIAALNSLLSDFGTQVASIRHGNDPMSSGECNAACIEYSKLRAIVIQKSSQYQDLAAQQSASPVGAALAPITGAVQSVEAAAASAGLPAWLLPAAGFFLLWKLL
jgi:hypothetical protein